MRLPATGNFGPGQSTLAGRVTGTNGLPLRALDAIAREPGKTAVQRPTDAVLASLDRLLDTPRPLGGRRRLRRSRAYPAA